MSQRYASQVLTLIIRKPLTGLPVLDALVWPDRSHDYRLRVIGTGFGGEPRAPDRYKQHRPLGQHLAGALREVAEKLEANGDDELSDETADDFDLAGKVRDLNGNSVGEWSVG